MKHFELFGMVHDTVIIHKVKTHRVKEIKECLNI